MVCHASMGQTSENRGTESPQLNASKLGRRECMNARPDPVGLAGKRYKKIRKYASHLVPSGYEITNRCNLKCEGCLFYEGEHYDARDGLEEVDDLKRYSKFFRSEVERGVSFPQIAGAEPSLVQDQLKIASRLWKNGVVFTNGLIRIDPEIKFMLHIGVWTVDPERDRRLRGAPGITKALGNYAGDRRAVFNFTMNHENLEEISEIVTLCKEHDVRVTFNHYSPTRQYRQKLDGGGRASPMGTFRFSSRKDNLMLTRHDLENIRETVDGLIDAHPETVVYSHYFNEWINRPESLYQIDPENGIATDCAVLNDPHHRQYKTDLTFRTRDCCSPNIDCSDCRIYASAYPRYLKPDISKFRSKEGFHAWVDVLDTWCRLHIYGWDELPD